VDAAASHHPDDHANPGGDAYAIHSRTPDRDADRSASHRDHRHAGYGHAWSARQHYPGRYRNPRSHRYAAARRSSDADTHRCPGDSDSGRDSPRHLDPNRDRCAGIANGDPNRGCAHPDPHTNAGWRAEHTDADANGRPRRFANLGAIADIYPGSGRDSDGDGCPARHDSRAADADRCRTTGVGGNYHDAGLARTGVGNSDSADAHLDPVPVLTHALRRSSVHQRPRGSGDGSDLMFYGILALTAALFLAAAIAIAQEAVVAQSNAFAAVAPPIATPSPPPTSSRVPAPVPTSPPPAPTATRAVIVVQSGGAPTRTARATPTNEANTPSPGATRVGLPEAGATPTFAPTATDTAVPTARADLNQGAVANPTDTPTASPSPKPEPVATPVIHVVTPGESFQSIAARYGVPWQSIPDANGLQTDHVLQIDQRLIIPSRP